MSEELHRHFSIGPELGRGRFGTVRRCTSLLSGDHFAVKSIDKACLHDPLDLASVEQEPKLTQLAAAGNPSVVQIHAVFEDHLSLHLVLDLLSGPDLFDRISASAPFSEPQAAQILASLMEAVAICHRRGIAHRDIKPDNVLFDDQGRLKLVDFGSAECFGDGRGMTGLVGTPYYVAPEVLAGREYDDKCDVWSAGVILYVMLAGFVPFYGESAAEIFEKVLRANLRFPAAVFRDVSPAAKDLMRRMLCKDVSRRLSAEQVLKYGMGNKVSPLGDVYSYGVLLLEMFTGRTPTNEMFKDGLSLHKFVEMNFPDRVMGIVDPCLLQMEDEDLRLKTEVCLVSVVRIGLACSRQSPMNRMQLSDVLREMRTIRDLYLGAETQVEIKNKDNLIGDDSD
ncbi:phosphoenolpyruvate carboxylase kinase 1 [Iris pallida]|uniref:Phosphoenolpyruvate carboxylase kinase 1 n=1 Tax=Iris pallida TaxID=29817 RepID=A0AAX6GYI8_IRIPA|nr:phosphoenolpyruvate carboxylase kinase 1 [Iris pallida]